MDPASAIIGIVSGAAGLVALCIQTVTFLTSISDNYKNAHLALWGLISSCEALENSWTNVHIWLESVQDQPNALSPLALDQLESFMSNSKIIVELLQKDLERLFPGWKLRLGLTATQRSARLAAKIFQHQNSIRIHCERINHQSTSLILLLNTIKLPSVPLQETILETFRLRFRKDEETAWTIVQTRPSTAVSRPSSITSYVSEMPSAHSIASKKRTSNEFISEQNTSLALVKFAFEDELLTSPVYKRVLYAALRGDSLKGSKSGEIRDIKDSNYQLHGYDHATSYADCDEAIRMLRDSRSFSSTCRDDLEALQAQGRSSKTLLPRHLPISNALCRQDLCNEEKDKLDQKFLQAVKGGNAEEVANLLDAGANINAPQNGSSLGDRGVALSLCIEKLEATSSPQDSDIQIANLLLLYHETLLDKFANVNCTLLHACMKHGIATIFGRIPVKAQILGVWDRFGNSPLHLAVLAGGRGLRCVEILCTMSREKSLKLGEILDSAGRSPLQLALEKGLDCQALLLVKLGGAGRVNRMAVASPQFSWTICDAYEKRYYHYDKGVSLEDLLQLAILKNRPEAVERLLTHGATWDAEILNTDNIVEEVTDTKLLLQLLRRRSIPRTRSINLTGLIRGKIWSQDRSDIEAALRGDKQNLFHECHRFTSAGQYAYFMSLTLEQPSIQIRQHCIHTVLKAVLSVLDNYSPSTYSEFTLDDKLKRQIEPQEEEHHGYNTWRAFEQHPSFPYLQ